MLGVSWPSRHGVTAPLWGDTKISKMATVEILKGEDWPLELFSMAPRVAKFVHNFCGLPYKASES